MKNFETIVQSKETLAAEVVGVATQSVRQNINVILRQIDPRDFSPTQYRYITQLLDGAALKLELGLQREVQSYAEWLDQDPDLEKADGLDGECENGNVLVEAADAPHD